MVICPPHARPHHANVLGEAIWKMASDEDEFTGSAIRWETPFDCVMDEKVMPVAGSKYFEAPSCAYALCGQPLPATRHVGRCDLLMPTNAALAVKAFLKRI